MTWFTVSGREAETEIQHEPTGKKKTNWEIREEKISLRRENCVKSIQMKLQRAECKKKREKNIR